MTFESYDLPPGAPAKFVWYAVCDGRDCTDVLGPFANWQVRDGQREIVESAGWRYRNNPPLMDTCPKCLEKEVPEDD